MSEKTEEPTQKKLDDARKKGQVGQSQDIPKLFIFAALIEMILTMVDSGMERLKELMILPIMELDRPFGAALGEVMTKAGLELLLFMLPVLGVAVVMRLAGGWVQFGPLFATEALKLDFERLNPINQFQQMFSSRQLFNLFNSLCKAVMITLVLYWLLPPSLGDLIGLAQTDLDSYWKALVDLFRRLSRICLGLLLVLAILDFALQKYFFIKGQRMSHEDIRKEYKESEGDPHMKSHRKSLAREISEKPGSAAPAQAPVEDADMLLVNPTHFAVALFYRPEQTPLPRIICKGRDADARELIERARKAGVPVVRFVWLARTLYRENVGQFIPRATLQAVAQVYRLLREIDEQAKGDTIEMPHY
ncbi:type III secretion system export apparatus subunit SctU [Pseudomonas cichorii]|uniref:EscU/YscU/HrcU family type III secretion system export apparatus switch protein n=1 Tax=Pseudomonas cichorii TaxID=36746 RepID=A0A3M4W926_PSECI|nr:type III secretion system export apparatus subunit SctU [Pseudomonas cichorii]AHF67071.1 type III secretion protein, YscU/HrpY family [Pseudomonas cichorii JBC1]QVE18948.1 type III secretion system export apparatus subunit SctU [Pseudomonas cichorii]RMR60648.1 Type III secretion protein, YscU/HrpY family [Pseudomonas cichorii]SDN61197.1 type III secretion protein U [Pseudomonas cichorii]GFM75625.1 EscU/YscU/HrcU family type III secretion system export apparatus switch protein [Pseudomonas c